MKKVVKILLIIAGTIAIALSAIFAYYGGFRTIEFKVEKTKSEIFVYENVIGNYNQSPIVMDSIYYALLNDLNIETTKGTCIYYDDPKQVEESNLRSEVGCLLDAPLDSITMVNLSNRFKVKSIPQGQYIVGRFPLKGTPSIIIAIMKVYPALNEYIDKNGYKTDNPIIEIYDVPEETIIYRKKITE